jgi:hypothetical protein
MCDMLNYSERLVRHRPYIALLFSGGILFLAGGLIATLQVRTAPGVDEAGHVEIATLPTVYPALELKPFTDQACLDCHTDQEALVALAVEDETPEVLSSGPG